MSGFRTVPVDAATGPVSFVFRNSGVRGQRLNVTPAKSASGNSPRRECPSLPWKKTTKTTVAARTVAWRNGGHWSGTFWATEPGVHRSFSTRAVPDGASFAIFINAYMAWRDHKNSGMLQPCRSQAFAGLSLFIELTLHRGNNPVILAEHGPCMNPHCPNDLLVDKNGKPLRMSGRGYMRRCSRCYYWTLKPNHRGDKQSFKPVCVTRATHDGCQNPACNEPEGSGSKFRGGGLERRCINCYVFRRRHSVERSRRDILATVFVKRRKTSEKLPDNEWQEFCREIGWTGCTGCNKPEETQEKMLTKSSEWSGKGAERRCRACMMKRLKQN